MSRIHCSRHLPGGCSHRSSCILGRRRAHRRPSPLPTPPRTAGTSVSTSVPSFAPVSAWIAGHLRHTQAPPALDVGRVHPSLAETGSPLALKDFRGGQGSLDSQHPAVVSSGADVTSTSMLIDPTGADRAHAYHRFRAVARTQGEAVPRLRRSLAPGDPGGAASGATSVSGIIEITGLTQSNVSNHLACLLDCGLVVREQRGRFAIYEIADARVEGLLAGGDEILSEVARGSLRLPAL
jgi:DNA-binding transcriptional ArsR family regulator